MQDIGIISAHDMTTEAAVTKMMYLLGTKELSNFKNEFKTSLRGELS